MDEISIIKSTGLWPNSGGMRNQESSILEYYTITENIYADKRIKILNKSKGE